MYALFSHVLQPLCSQSLQWEMPRRVMAFFAPWSVQWNVFMISASVWLAAVPLVSHLRAEEGRQREERRGRGKKKASWFER